jgi:phosphoglycolate phosphatase-like HAD superfamily hydrolase
MMEILIKTDFSHIRLRAALIDFDGTISTLRHGWELVMEPLVLEMIAGPTPVDAELVQEVRDYISQSTGVQTYYQMKWLAEAVSRHGRNPGASADPWWYKDEYNRRLMSLVGQRKQNLLDGKSQRANFLIMGSEAFLQALRAEGVDIFVASGTDHPDVVEEAGLLGLSHYFKAVAGAPPRRADCSKEAVLRQLVQEQDLLGPEVVVVGDGRVEIALGQEAGARTLGVASDEDRRYGINPAKRTRLIKAGAQALVGDFVELGSIMAWLTNRPGGTAGVGKDGTERQAQQI